MKLDKIYSLFRKSSNITLINKFVDDNIRRQYIHDGACIYALDENLPTLNENAVAIFIGRDPESCHVEATEMSDFLAKAMSDDYNPSDRLLQIAEYSFFDLSVLMTQDGESVVFVNTKYIKPFGDDVNIDYRLRVVNDTQLVVVRYGMFVIAAIMPMRFMDAGLNKNLELTRKVYRALTRLKEG